nr:hypothetical protein [Candidatus Sigynarchaeum springense]
MVTARFKLSPNKSSGRIGKSQLEDNGCYPQRTRKPGTPYHEFACTTCGRVGNRHQVSARVAALLLKRYIEHGTTASTGTENASRSSADFL